MFFKSQSLKWKDWWGEGGEEGKEEAPLVFHRASVFGLSQGKIFWSFTGQECLFLTVQELPVFHLRRVFGLSRSKNLWSFAEQ